VDPNNIYADLRDNVVAYQVVHAGTLVFIGLIGLALYMLVRDLPGRAAAISRLAIGPFVLFYAAYESVIGLAVGALVQHGNDAPVRQRPAVADSIQSLGGNAIVGDPGVVSMVGSLSWVVAVVAAAIAYRQIGAPLLATILLALSFVVVSHPPPIGPIGLACFSGAVVLLARAQHVSMRAVGPASPAPVTRPI